MQDREGSGLVSDTVWCGVVCCRVVAPESASAFADLLTEVLFATPMRGSRTSEACRVLTVRHYHTHLTPSDFLLSFLSLLCETSLSSCGLVSNVMSLCVVCAVP
jgi:hypothetical protein